MTAVRPPPSTPPPAGPPAHLVDDAQCAILAFVPETSAAQTVGVRKALLTFETEVYNTGIAYGESVAATRLRERLGDLGTAYVNSLRYVGGLADYELPLPTLALVARELRALGTVATDDDVATLIRVAGLPVADADERTRPR